MDALTPEAKAALDQAYGRSPSLMARSVILHNRHSYETQPPQSRLEISILDREDLPLMDQTAEVWVLGAANEELFGEEDHVRRLLEPSGLHFRLSPHARTGRRRHGFWLAELL
jgi:hypothetical protein